MKNNHYYSLVMLGKYVAYTYAFSVMFFSVALANDSSAQKVVSVKEVTLTLDVSNEPLINVFRLIEQKTNYKFVYDPGQLAGQRTVTVKSKKNTLEKVLLQISRQANVGFRQVNDRISVKVNVNGRHEKGIDVTIEQARVTGKVTDENGEPLPGAAIIEKGTTNGTVTDVDGNFSLAVPKGAILLVSFVGYSAQEITVGDQLEIYIQLEPDIYNLEEIVVLGYGTQRRSNVVGAVDQVGVEQLNGRPNVNVSQALQGVSPNLIVQQANSEPGAGVNLNIRGISTLGNNSPLIVIDGIIGADINLLNPSDIENISVLKDAGSAAIYGSRANNGVILITTRKGEKNKAMSVTYNGLLGLNVPHFFMEPVSGYENAILRNESAFNAGKSSVVYTPEEIRQFRENGDEEWFADEITRSALQQNHNLSLSGGNDRSTYFISLGYVDQQSNFVGPGRGLKRYNYRVNLTNEVGRFKLTSMLSYVRREIKDHSFNTSTLMVDASRVPLIYSQKDSLGRYLTNDVLQQFNSLGVLEKGGFREYDDDNVFGNLAAEFRITDDIKLKGVFGGSLYANHQFGRTLQVDFFPKGVYGDERNTYDESRKSLDLNTQLMAEFSKTLFEKHSLNVLVGVSNENHTDRGTGIYKTFTDLELGTPVTETVVSPDSYTSNQSSSENSLNSLFGRASYAFGDKYFAEFNFRYDGSSKFSEGNRWGFFPSGSLGYLLTKESFMRGYRDRFGSLKVRASYGVLGNQNVDNYQYQTTYFTFPDAYGFNNSVVGGTGYNFANANIRWERAATFNVGVDMDFFNTDLSLSLDYFNKVTSDILVPPAVPGVFGTDLPDFNAGKVGNQGWEISLSYRHQGRLLSHQVAFNLADSWNEVLDFQDEERLTGREELQLLLREGYPYHSYVGLKRDGYFQNLEDVENSAKPEGLTDLQPGDNKYVDINDDGVINDEDNFIFGNPFPRLTFGLTYDLTFKGFDVNIFLQGVGRRTMMLRGELVEPFHFNYGMTMYKHQLDYWTPQNPSADYPRLADNGSQSNTNNFRRGSDMYLFDAAYLRVKNVQIGYTLPASIAQKAGAQKIRAYLSGQNLFTLSKIKFVDPELTEFDSDLSSSGANSGRAYPTMIFYGAGLDVTF